MTNSMKAVGTSVEEILTQVDAERNAAFRQLHKTIVEHLPKGFVPAISYGGLGYVIPHSLYPEGYHCKPSEPLPFAGISAQKGTINLYHMGLYASEPLMKWFVSEYPKHSIRKLDMGKSCVRFKRHDEIPLGLVGELMTKMSSQEWIDLYESLYHPKKKSR